MWKQVQSDSRTFREGWSDLFRISKKSYVNVTVNYKPETTVGLLKVEERGRSLSLDTSVFVMDCRYIRTP